MAIIVMIGPELHIIIGTLCIQIDLSMPFLCISKRVILISEI